MDQSEYKKWNQVFLELNMNSSYTPEQYQTKMAQIPKEFFDEADSRVVANQTVERLDRILNTRFAKRLGSPTDFSGYERIMFSLDNHKDSYINDRTLPLILALIEEIVDARLELRICHGAYRMQNGPWTREVSFLFKFSPADCEWPKIDFDTAESRNDVQSVYFRLLNYVEAHTRQESVLLLDEKDNAFLHFLREPDSEKKHSPLGIWTEVPKEVALEQTAFTNIGDRWYICKPVASTEKSKL